MIAGASAQYRQRYRPLGQFFPFVRQTLHHRITGHIAARNRSWDAAATKSRRRTTVFIALLASAIGSSGLGASGLDAPPATLSLQAAVTYAVQDDQALLCDLYFPAGHVPARESIAGDASATEDTHRQADSGRQADSDRSAGLPAVILVHGGAWASGSRQAMISHARRLAEAGFVAMAIDYRLAPSWKFPAQLDDLRRALWWLSDNSQRLGVDRQRIGLFGYSAGGHLACLLGTLVDEPAETVTLTSHWSADDRRLVDLPRPAAICAGGPPCDLTFYDQGNGELAYFLGGSAAELPQLYAAASPLNHASAGDVPLLVFHGQTDSIVPPDASRRLVQQQQAAGVASEYLAVDGRGHLMTFLSHHARDAMVDFFQRSL